MPVPLVRQNPSLAWLPARRTIMAFAQAERSGAVRPQGTAPAENCAGKLLRHDGEG